MAVKWMKTGEASAKAAVQAKADAERRKEEYGKMFRFWLKDGEEARITFVDGELSDQGFLLPPRYYEHDIELKGKFGNIFVCPEKTNPESGQKCPICEEGHYPSLVALFTVIDHRPYTTEAGKTYQDTAKLFPAKQGTFEILNKLAVKRQGLAGCTFDVSRSGDKSPKVGSLFDFVEKHTDIEGLKKLYVREYKDKDGKLVKKSSFVPADYESEIVFRDEIELRKMGFGKASINTGASTGFKGGDKPATSTDYSEHL